MKKILLIMVFIPLFMSCDQVFDAYLYSMCDSFSIYSNDVIYYQDDFLFSDNRDKEYENYLITSILIREKVKYKSDPDSGYLDYWRSPKTTWETGFGDCEDIAFLYANIIYVNTGIKLDLVWADTGKMRTIESGGYVDHVLVRTPDGIVLEPRTGKPVSVPVGFSLKFDDVFDS